VPVDTSNKVSGKQTRDYRCTRKRQHLIDLVAILQEISHVIDVVLNVIQRNQLHLLLQFCCAGLHSGGSMNCRLNWGDGNIVFTAMHSWQAYKVTGARQGAAEPEYAEKEVGVGTDCSLARS